jgi:hypothetical protein
MKRYNPRQRTGTEFGGATPNQNTTQPMDRFSDLSASDQAKLIKTTGQTADPSAPARVRNFLGQKGDKPRG